jgi:hypothetical protein
LRFYEVFPAGNLEGFAQILVRENEGVVVIGTDLLSGQKVESSG